MGRSAYVFVRVREGTVAQLTRAVRALQAQDADFPNLNETVRSTADGFSATGWWYKYPAATGNAADTGIISRRARSMLAQALGRQGLSGECSVVPWDEGLSRDVVRGWAPNRIPRIVLSSFQPRRTP